MRNIRTRTSAVAATALLAALSLTACQGDGNAAVGSPSASTTGGQDSAAAPSAPAAGKPADGGDTASGTSGGKGGTGGKSAGSSASKGGDTGSAVTTPCGDRVKVTYSKVSRPINHGLLTLTNTGSKACNAYHAPLLRFDEAQAATAINDDSRPQAVVTLLPGESAYASIMLSSADGSGTNGSTAKQLAVSFAPRDGGGSTDAAPAGVTLPAGTYIDTTTSVTYWQSSMEDALTW
ncbi:DUF4232 domain-containing protein [Streptomyces sp. AM8-1-1]|uniref:DUF4232 domain-containing protein n=1 Tax=Streptomyces sp. AM8-1-1 TaxID=3075825 RepID=UPI0028C4F2D6|nr:DUF4232 domain-containing protein [Streptomyces sp. AM8-1-1]WNO73100.1 DUF4232 domain-containing protein [Streptomyces sp. AM8-1-1]